MENMALFKIVAMLFVVSNSPTLCQAFTMYRLHPILRLTFPGSTEGENSPFGKETSTKVRTEGHPQADFFSWYFEYPHTSFNDIINNPKELRTYSNDQTIYQNIPFYSNLETNQRSRDGSYFSPFLSGGDQRSANFLSADPLEPTFEFLNPVRIQSLPHLNYRTVIHPPLMKDCCRSKINNIVSSGKLKPPKLTKSLKVQSNLVHVPKSQILPKNSQNRNIKAFGRIKSNTPNSIVKLVALNPSTLSTNITSETIKEPIHKQRLPHSKSYDSASLFISNMSDFVDHTGKLVKSIFKDVISSNKLNFNSERKKDLTVFDSSEKDLFKYSTIRSKEEQDFNSFSKTSNFKFFDYSDESSEESSNYFDISSEENFSDYFDLSSEEFYPFYSDESSEENSDYFDDSSEESGFNHPKDGSDSFYYQLKGISVTLPTPSDFIIPNLFREKEKLTEGEVNFKLGEVTQSNLETGETDSPQQSTSGRSNSGEKNNSEETEDDDKRIINFDEGRIQEHDIGTIEDDDKKNIHDDDNGSIEDEDKESIQDDDKEDLKYDDKKSKQDDDKEGLQFDDKKSITDDDKESIQHDDNGQSESYLPQ